MCTFWEFPDIPELLQKHARFQWAYLPCWVTFTFNMKIPVFQNNTVTQYIYTLHSIRIFYKACNYERILVKTAYFVKVSLIKMLKPNPFISEYFIFSL